MLSLYKLMTGGEDWGDVYTLLDTMGSRYCLESVLCFVVLGVTTISEMYISCPVHYEVYTFAFVESHSISFGVLSYRCD